jgi:hypothetical protein
MDCDVALSPSQVDNLPVPGWPQAAQHEAQGEPHMQLETMMHSSICMHGNCHEQDTTVLVH